jgi:hypothetical protein
MKCIHYFWLGVTAGLGIAVLIAEACEHQQKKTRYEFNQSR